MRCKKLQHCANGNPHYLNLPVGQQKGNIEITTKKQSNFKESN